MFKDTQSYEKGLKRIDFLLKLEESIRLSQDDAHELAELLVAEQMFRDAQDAEAAAEYSFMQRFEDHFMASMER